MVPASTSSAARSPAAADFFRARLAHALHERSELTHFLPARVHTVAGEPEASALPWQGLGRCRHHGGVKRVPDCAARETELGCRAKWLSCCPAAACSNGRDFFWAVCSPGPSRSLRGALGILFCVARGLLKGLVISRSPRQTPRSALPLTWPQA